MSDIRELGGDEINFVSGGDTMNSVIRRMGQSASMGRPDNTTEVAIAGGGFLIFAWIFMGD